MSNIWEIDERLVNLIDGHFDVEDGVIYESEDELAKKIDEVALELDKKIENIGCYIKNLESDVDALKKEEDNLKKRRKSAENKIEGLKRYLDGYLTACYPNESDKAKWKFKTAKCVLGFRKSTSVEVPNIDELDKGFIKVKTELSADKTAIKDAIKSGKEVKGAFLKNSLNLSVK